VNARELTITSMIVAVLTVGLFVTLIANTFSSLDSSYSGGDYNSSSLSNYSHLTSLSTTIEAQSQTIDEDVYVDKNVFDYIAGIFDKLSDPLRFTYQSYKTVFSMSSGAVRDLNLFPAFNSFFRSVILTLVLIGIVMFAIYLKVKQ
jgi:hypothetical protein